MGQVLAEVLHRSGKEVDDVDGKMMLLWCTVHGLAALTLVGRIVGGQQEAHRLAEQAVHDALAVWRAG